MIKIFSSDQVRKADEYTIENEPVASIDLMERAAEACVGKLFEFTDMSKMKVLIFCGPGNNGGDGLAIARMLHMKGVRVMVFQPDDDEKKSADFVTNRQRLLECGVELNSIGSFTPGCTDENTIIIDALFGSGLSKPLKGIYKEVVDQINQINCISISIDIPSGLYADKPVNSATDTVINADYTLSFQFPKLAFLFPENEFFCGEWHLIPIGLHSEFIKSETCKKFLIEYSDVKSILKPRSNFSHKGSFGHALLIGGSKGKIGASVLMSRSCLHSGAGLVTVHLPACGYTIIQTSVPEVMVSVDRDENECTTLPRLDSFSSIAVGPGLGNSKSSAAMLKHLIQEARVPLILDADAVNILADNPTWLAFLPKGTILTPHPGEFARIAGKTSNSFDRLETLKSICIRYGLNIVLKGAYTVTCNTEGICWFNTTGNPGMATGGSGDVLTGILAGLLAQNYSPTQACILGVYLHGLAGDLAGHETGYEALIAGKIIDYLGIAFQELY